MHQLRRVALTLAATASVLWLAPAALAASDGYQVDQFTNYYYKYFRVCGENQHDDWVCTPRSRTWEVISGAYSGDAYAQTNGWWFKGTVDFH